MSGPVGASDAEELVRLQAAVGSLRKLDREIFLAHRRDAMTYDQIASMTGLSRRHVKRRMARALFEIGQFMGGKHPPWWRRWLR